MDAATDCPDNILLILKKRGLSGNKMFKYITLSTKILNHSLWNIDILYYNWKYICGWSLNRANKQSSEIVGQEESFMSLSKGQPSIKADTSIAVILLQYYRIDIYLPCSNNLVLMPLSQRSLWTKDNKKAK